MALILAGLVVLTQPHRCSHGGGQSDVVRAETQMANLETAIQMYFLKRRELPTSLEALTEADPHTGEAYLDRIPLDPWVRPYRYEIHSETAFRIVSDGEDRRAGTADDLSWPPQADPRGPEPARPD